MLHNKRRIYKRYKAALTTAAFLLFSNMLYCQAALRIDSLVSCPNSDAIVSVYVNNFQDINAITLYIHFDTLHVRFSGTANAHPNLAGGSLMSNSSFGNNSVATMIVTWYRTAPSLTIADGKLFDLLLYYKEGNANLTFGAACEIAKGIQIIENAAYTNGAILPLIFIQPVSASRTEGEQATFFVNHDSGNLSQWQINSGSGWSNLSDTYPYQGSMTNELKVQPLTLSMNNYSYRCVVSAGSCQMISDSAILLVSPLSINEKAIDNFGLYVYPNPNNGIFHLTTNLTFKNIRLSLLDFSGKMILSMFFEELRAGDIETVSVSHLQKGIYFTQFSNNERILHCTKVVIE